MINFDELLNLYFLANRLPTNADQADSASGRQSSVGTGTVGGNDRRVRAGLVSSIASNFVRSSPPALALGCVNIALIGEPGLPLPLVGITVVSWPDLALWEDNRHHALSATYYPTDSRSTGIGAGLGIGGLEQLLAAVGEACSWTSIAHTEAVPVAAIRALTSAIVTVGMHWVLNRKHRPRRGSGPESVT